MAINAATSWEIRPSGNDANGFGFADLSPGVSVDYTQQDAAQLSSTDLATDGAGTGLSSVTGGFTAAMVGNVIKITGGTLTPGYYQLTAHTDTNNVTIDSSAGLSASGSSGKVGGGRATLTDACFDPMTNGNTMYLKNFPASGYNVNENIVFPGAALTIRKSLIGYDTDRSVAPTGDNRPLIHVVNIYDFKTGAEWNVRNIRIDTPDYDGFYVDSYNVIENCKVVNRTPIADKMAIRTGTAVMLIDCEVICPGGYGLRLYYQAWCQGCYMHDSKFGTGPTEPSCVMIDCIVANCGTGIYSWDPATMVSNSSIFGCGEGHYAAGADYGYMLINNVFAECTSAVKHADATASGTMFFDYNNFYNNVTDNTNVGKGPHTMNYDPQFTDAAIIRGTTATTSSKVLTDAGADFSNVTDNVDYCFISAGATLNNRAYLIVAHTTTTLTFARITGDPGDSVGDVVYSVVTGNDFSLHSDSELRGAGFALGLAVG